MANIIQRIYKAVVNSKSTEEKVKNLNKHRGIQTISRSKQDIQSWRNALTEAERAWYPHRVKIQTIYADTVLNGHVDACIKKRESLTMGRRFVLSRNGKEDEVLTKAINKPWMLSFIKYVLEAQAYGYTLVTLGDIVNSNFPNLSIVNRTFISPDRLNVVSYQYNINGIDFLQPPYSDWHVYVKTDSDNGISACGMGYLLKVALCEIMLRNNTANNADFNELFAQPVRIARTNKTDGEDLDQLEFQLQEIGSKGYAIMDTMDELTFVESSQKSGAVQTYESFEKRLESKISKIILGHADALDSTPGKLGAESSVEKALMKVMEYDGFFVENVINENFIPSLIKHKLLPVGVQFNFKNSHEINEIKQRDTENTQKWATIAQTMSQAGLYLDPKVFEEKTGIKTIAKQPAVDSIQNKLKSIYGV